MKVANFYKCKSTGYSSYTKGKIYHIDVIGEYLDKHIDDWSPILDYPTSIEILDCISEGKKKNKVTRALNQWKNQR